MILENIDQRDIDSLNLPAFIVSNNSSLFIIKQANILFINLLKKSRDAVVGKALDDVFPKSLEFKYYPHHNSLIEGLKEAGSSKRNIQITPEHFVLFVNDAEVFEINRWALSIRPILKKEEDIDGLLVTVVH